MKISRTSKSRAACSRGQAMREEKVSHKESGAFPDSRRAQHPGNSRPCDCKSPYSQGASNLLILDEFGYYASSGMAQFAELMRAHRKFNGAVSIPQAMQQSLATEPVQEPLAE